MLRASRVLLLGLAIGGCAAHGLDFRLSFETPELRVASRRVQARILEGACPGTTLVYSVDLYAGTEAPDPPRLGGGTYCFTARAANATCQWIADAEATLELPADDSSVDLVLRTHDAGRDCGAALCVDGRCPSAPLDDDGGTPGFGPFTLASSCPGDTACGGDPTGSWRYAGGCFVDPSTDLREQCPGYTVVSGTGTVIGTLSLDGARVAQDLTVAGSLVLDFPSSCAPGGCSVLGLQLAEAAGTPGSCEAMGGGCRCDVTVAQSIDWSGAYTISGGAITVEDGTTLDFCVSGDTLRYAQTDASRVAIGTLELDR